MTNSESNPYQAATDPEMDIPPRPVYAVGIGPGNLSYLHPQTRSIVENADVIVGFETVLDRIRDLTHADILPCTYENETSQLSEFNERIEDGEMGAAVLMGDPNVSGYTFVGKIEQATDRPVRVVPGLSSVQVAASRSRTPLESSVIVTLHTRGDLRTELDRLVREAGIRHLLVLPRPYDYMPENIANTLVDRGVETSLNTHVYERLTFDDESCARTTLNELASKNTDNDSVFSDLSVMIIRGES